MVNVCIICNVLDKWVVRKIVKSKSENNSKYEKWIQPMKERQRLYELHVVYHKKVVNISKICLSIFENNQIITKSLSQF